MTGKRKSKRARAMAQRHETNNSDEQARSDIADDDDDDKVTLQYKKAGKSEVAQPFVASAVPRKILTTWTKAQRELCKKKEKAEEPEKLKALEEAKQPEEPGQPEGSIEGAKKDVNGNIMLQYRRGGENRIGKPWSATWVPATALSRELVTKWVDHHQNAGQTTGGLDGSISESLERADWDALLQNLEETDLTTSSQPDERHIAASNQKQNQNQSGGLSNTIQRLRRTSIQHFPIPIATKGICDEAAKSLNNTTHTNNVAPCQSDKPHLSNPHLVCTNCNRHENPPIHRLTQHEQNHMIRDNGFFPLCIKCADHWISWYGISPDWEADKCTCDSELPQWLCVDCWIEMAKARSRRREDCSRCNCLEEVDTISETVRVCSGCEGIVVRDKW